MKKPAARSTLFAPVARDTRRALARAWGRVPAKFRAPRQYLGRQYAGCGAVIGAMPRCDFACRGCYLGEDANRIPAASLGEVKRQLVRLREWLGEGGNVQITDGEVTLRDPEELAAMVRGAREVGLVPMLMTHGETFRREPERLERLMLDAGLREVSIHIDTTQRGRRSADYRYADRELKLDPLRDEFAELIRGVRARTGRPLDVASTVTVTPENLSEVPHVIRWFVNNADAFKMISFQPIARVGRTEDGLGGGVSAEDLWKQIEIGLTGSLAPGGALADHDGWLGHPSCNRFVQGIVRRGDGTPPRFFPVQRHDDPEDVAVLDGLLERIGGITFRNDDRLGALARALGVLAAHPVFLLREVLPFAMRWSRRIAPDGRLRFIARWLRGHERIDYLNLVSHHFMSADELQTEEGRERADLCVFQVPIGDDLVSMCEVNALGVRDRYYEALRVDPEKPDLLDVLTPDAPGHRREASC